MQRIGQQTSTTDMTWKSTQNNPMRTNMTKYDRIVRTTQNEIRNTKAYAAYSLNINRTTVLAKPQKSNPEEVFKKENQLTLENAITLRRVCFFS